tara:strand:- start:211 stop:450 length:240 start_codon:yes stop_codon:yes gene_type:complete
MYSPKVKPCTIVKIYRNPSDSSITLTGYEMQVRTGFPSAPEFHAGTHGIAQVTKIKSMIRKPAFPPLGKLLQKGFIPGT